jgi:hypothetical protein
MSASMSRTRDPPNASAYARLHAVVVFPSSGWLLVTATTRGPSDPLVKTSDVRSDRNASPKSWHRLRRGGTLVAHRRHEAQQQPQPARDVVRRLDRVVEVFDAEREAERDQQAARSAVNQSRRAFGKTAPRGFGTVHDRVVRPAVADDAQFLLLLQDD